MQCLLHTVFTAQKTALLRATSFAHGSAEIHCTQFGALVFDAHRLVAWCFAPLLYSTRLLYSYITTLVLHYYTTATLLPLYYTTATCYYTLWLHYDTTATLPLHCELTRTRNTLHYYTLFRNTATLLQDCCTTGHTTATILPHRGTTGCNTGHTTSQHSHC